MKFKGIIPTMKDWKDSTDWEHVGEVIGKVLTDIVTCGIIAFIGHVAFSMPWLIIAAVAVLSIFVRSGLADRFNK